MQTFLPYPDFDRSLQCLDRQRLGKQRCEAKQIVDILTWAPLSDGRPRGTGWVFHPAVLMWLGYTDALRAYYNCTLLEWELRGYVNNMQRELVPDQFPLPSWISDPAFHTSHRSRLLQKNREWYGKFGWEEIDLPYVWPKPSQEIILDWKKFVTEKTKGIV